MTNVNDNIIKDKQQQENEWSHHKNHLLSEIEGLRLTHQKYISEMEITVNAYINSINKLKKDIDLNREMINNLSNDKNNLLSDLNKTQFE